MSSQPTASSQSQARQSIVILGGGVIGLTIAHVLTSESDWESKYALTVVARELPDHHMNSGGWASPWAGANWAPLGEYDDERKVRWEKETVKHLRSLIPEGLVAELPFHIYFESAKLYDPQAASLWKDIVRNFKEIPTSELPAGSEFGISFDTVSIRPSEYLPWLYEQVIKRGVTFVHKHVNSIEEAAHIGGNNSIVVNATAMGAKSLLGVEDIDVYPLRGQTIIVDAPDVKTHCTRIPLVSSSEATYIIPRPDGTVILGGSRDEDRYDLLVDNKAAAGILERCTQLEPKLKGAKILNLNVGLRPARHGGTRVEKEIIELPLESKLVPWYGVEDSEKVKRDLTVIHAYGLSGSGYQSSWGVARNVAEILASV